MNPTKIVLLFIFSFIIACFDKEDYIDKPHPSLDSTIFIVPTKDTITPIPLDSLGLNDSTSSILPNPLDSLGLNDSTSSILPNPLDSLHLGDTTIIVVPNEDKIFKNPLDSLHLQDTTVTIFQAGEDGYAFYRIPTIIKDENGVLYAFAEGRKNSINDWGDIDLVMRKSLDGGTTWSRLFIIKDDGLNKCGDPVPVFDAQNNRILLIWRWGIEGKTVAGYYRPKNSHNGLKFFSTYSCDGGETWSPDIDISYIIPDSIGSFDVGPVHGIQLHNDLYKDRIVITGYCTMNEQYHSLSFFSENGGDSWSLSNIIIDGYSDECTVTELKNGTLLLSQRFNSHINNNKDKIRPHRLESTSTDGGRTWSDTKKSELIEPVCQASILTYSYNGALTDTLLFSNPHNQKIRENLTIQLSPDNGKSWKVFKTITPKPSGYSDMVQLRNDKIGVLYENGEKESYEKIDFTRFTIE